MLWKKASKLKLADFKRKTGFRLYTFQAMLSVVNNFKSSRRKKDKICNQSN